MEKPACANTRNVDRQAGLNDFQPQSKQQALNYHLQPFEGGDLVIRHELVDSLPARHEQRVLVFCAVRHMKNPHVPYRNKKIRLKKNKFEPVHIFTLLNTTSSDITANLLAVSSSVIVEKCQK